MGGYRVVVSAELVASREGGLRAPLEAGNRSLIFQFKRLGEAGKPVNFGAIVEEVLEGDLPGSGLVAVVMFWEDLAQVYATPGAEFDLWLGRIVGHGRVHQSWQGTSGE
jgi:hypothetical protein